MFCDGETIADNDAEYSLSSSFSRCCGTGREVELRSHVRVELAVKISPLDLTQLSSRLLSAAHLTMASDLRSRGCRFNYSRSAAK